MVVMLSRGRRQPVCMYSRRTAWMAILLTCGVFWSLVAMGVNMWLLTDTQNHATLAWALLFSAVGLLLGVGYPSLKNKVMQYRGRRLRRAIAHGDIRAWYQPIVTGSQGHVSGCEVLARWHLPGGRVLGPEHFITLAEDNGLIVPMTRILVRQVCRDLARIQAWLPVGFDVSVNLSAAHAGSPQFLQDCRRLQRTLAGRGGQVTAEVGERTLFLGGAGGHQLLMALRDAGVRVMLDDFATGAQGLEALDTLPVDGFKIDRRHVRELACDGPVSMAELMIRLGHLMSLELVAEGVETQAQHEWLLAQGVFRQQGYHFSAPLQVDGLALYLACGGGMKEAVV